MRGALAKELPFELPVLEKLLQRFFREPRQIRKSMNEFLSSTSEGDQKVASFLRGQAGAGDRAGMLDFVSDANRMVTRNYRGDPVKLLPEETLRGDSVRRALGLPSNSQYQPRFFAQGPEVYSPRNQRRVEERLVDLLLKELSS